MTFKNGIQLSYIICEFVILQRDGVVRWQTKNATRSF